MKNGTLIGKLFITFEKREGYDRKTIKHQGGVIAKITDEIYLVELYSFIDGCATCQRLVTLQEMLGWDFYADKETFDYYFQKACSYSNQLWEETWKKQKNG